MQFIFKNHVNVTRALPFLSVTTILLLETLPEKHNVKYDFEVFPLSDDISDQKQK